MVSETLITEEKRQDIAERISMRIYEKLFISGDTMRSIKIVENIGSTMISLLGKKIKTDKIGIYISMYVDKYVSAIVRKGEAVGVIAAQSLVQPITQAVLKSQHGTGRKQESGSTSLIHLNRLKVATTVINVHLKKIDEYRESLYKKEKDEGIQKEFRRDLLTRMRNAYEEVKFGDILTSVFGDAKYSPDKAGEDYWANPLYTYINHDRNTLLKQPIYKFVVDKDKLWDSGISIGEVIMKLADNAADVMVVIHPLSTYRFDLVPGMKSLSIFLKFINDLMKLKLKGIDNLAIVQEKKIKASEAIKLNHYDPDPAEVDLEPESWDTSKGQSHLFIVPEMLLVFPLDELMKRVIRPLTPEKKEEFEVHKASVKAYNTALKKKHPAVKGLNLTEEEQKAHIIEWSKDITKNPQKLADIEKWEEEKRMVIPIKRPPAVLAEGGNNATLKSKMISGQPLHLRYDGKVELSDDFYSYFIFHSTAKTADTGKDETMTMTDIVNHVKDDKGNSLVDRRYMISNDAREMVDFVGKTAARINHEYLYSVELTGSKSSLLYQHISVICRNIFRHTLNPITPAGFIKSHGVNALDRMSFQNYQQNLSAEIIKGKKSKTETLTTSILVGRPPKLGTAFNEFIEDDKVRSKMVKLYSKARQAQRYDGKFKGHDFTAIGTLAIRTVIPTMSEFVLKGDHIKGLV